MREVAAAMWTRGLGEEMDANRTVHGAAYGLVQGIELAIRLGMKLVMLGCILPSRWWRRGLSVNCRSSRISATSVNRLLKGRVKCARPWCLAGKKEGLEEDRRACACSQNHAIIAGVKIRGYCRCSQGVRRALSICWWKLPLTMSLQKTVI